MPVITRLYTKSEIGLLGVIMGILAIVGPIATLQYSQAIMLADNDVEASETLQLSLLIALITTVLLLLGVALCRTPLAAFAGAPQIASWLWTIPILAFLTGMTQALQVWLSRQKTFSPLAGGRASQTLVTVSVQGVWGYMRPGVPWGLLLGYLWGLASMVGVLLYGARGSVSPVVRSIREIRWTRLLALAKRWRKFPLFSTPGSLAAGFTNDGFVLVISAVSNPAGAGAFYLMHRTLCLPISLVSQSIGPAIYQRLNAARQHGHDEAAIIAQIFTGLFVVGMLPFGIVAFMGPWLYGIVFGLAWTEAGIYARWGCVAYLMKFCVIPLTQGFYVYEKQEFGCAWQCVGCALAITSGVAAAYFGTVEHAVIAFAASNTIMCGIALTMVLRWAGISPGSIPGTLVAAAVALPSQFLKR
ncbi:MAG: oligosaccharide flippase family protein [Fuerstiella sp.]|nr:oligosaccharide flippase family protein [Fuerstiella sp.]